jgi:hypothetical protein
VDGLGRWYCCLTARERGVLRDTALALPLTLFVGIPREVWDAIWLPSPPYAAAYVEAFQQIYGLEIVTIEVDDVSIEVVAPADGYLPFWVEASVFVLTLSALCFDPCEWRRPY